MDLCGYDVGLDRPFFLIGRRLGALYPELDLAGTLRSVPARSSSGYKAPRRRPIMA
ncbi:hypothetical protein QWA_17565 [Alcaligenes faecalis subsp. faecalis NCIB 8687]|nr:hypothetical protein QWA_17565 [Alcaligenes faecalis subsp. faecalis NCIB 8687]